MALKKMEQLEKLAARYVNKSREILDEKNRLTQEVQRLKEELEAARSEHGALRQDLKELSRLKEANQKMESDKTIIRGKIKRTLDNLGKMDTV